MGRSTGLEQDLFLRGFTQVYDIDYKETFSAVVRYTSIRVILSLAAKRNMSLYQFDIKTAFLYGEVKEDIYMKQPLGYNDKSGNVCKLLKSLYGLKQSSRCWNECFTTFIKEFGFIASKPDTCTFIREHNKKKVILAIYVDDALIVAHDEADVAPVIAHLSKKIEIKIVNSKVFLGMEINRDANGGIHHKQCTS